LDGIVIEAESTGKRQDSKTMSPMKNIEMAPQKVPLAGSGHDLPAARQAEHQRMNLSMKNKALGLPAHQ